MEVKVGYKQTDVGVIPDDWDCVQIHDVARLESGHTPRRTVDAYWNGSIPWVSLHDTESLDQNYIYDTTMTVTQLGIDHSSARLLPAGTVVFSRTATVGKATILGRAMATSQDFANYVCGPKLCNLYLIYLLRAMTRTWESLMAGSTHKTIYMPTFEKLQIPLPSVAEQQEIAAALADADSFLVEVSRLIAKKRDLKRGAMRELLTGGTRLPGFQGKWEVRRLGALGTTYGGLTGKSKADFGVGTGRYVTFLNVITNVVIDCALFGRVRVAPTETQNRVKKGDLLFTGSSETPGEVAMCAFMADAIPSLFLNSFCFGLRLRDETQVDGLFLAYYMRGNEGREVMKSLAQGSTRYNLSKGALLEAPLLLPLKDEQAAIAAVLMDIDAELAALEDRREKTRDLKQAMMQELLTGKTRLVPSGAANV